MADPGSIGQSLNPGWGFLGGLPARVSAGKGEDRYRACPRTVEFDGRNRLRALLVELGGR